MDSKKKKLQGERLKEARKLIGLSQEQFCDWLESVGITGNYGEKYGAPTVAAWENARRNVPEKVKKAICENLTINGQNVQYAYMNGDTKYITQSPEGVTEAIYTEARELQQHVKEEKPADLTKYLCNYLIDAVKKPSNQLGVILRNDILPLYGVDITAVFDEQRFNEHVFNKLQEIIFEYIENEKNGL